MLQIELTLLIAACILGIMDTKSRIIPILRVIGCAICLILFIVWFRDGKLMPIITAVALIFLGSLINTCIREKEWTVILVSLPFIIGVLYLNRGITTRFYDPAGQFSFAERYNMNAQMRYDSAMPNGTLYIVTQNLDGDMEKENKVKGKLHKKKDYYLICMNYDQEGNYAGTGYGYSVRYTHEEQPANPELYADKISEKIRTDGTDEIVTYIAECVNATFYGGNPDWGDEYYGEQWDEPDSGESGVHWVEGYDRQDGTHVDGYLRTDPDGDPTNNFSYTD